MNKPQDIIYSTKFYGKYIAGSHRSALIILDSIFEIIKPESVVDVGCGKGAWLLAAERLGVNILTGIDGNWVDREALLSEKITFKNIDLENQINGIDRHNVAISVEVAEHLTSERAESFVSDLCDLADVVLFSAAIEGQGGSNHLNEQNQSYWAKLFKNNGFDCFDIIRPLIWENPLVEICYRQNIMLYISHESVHHQQFMSHKAIHHNILNIVHPMLFKKKLERIDQLNMLLESKYKEEKAPSLTYVLKCIIRFVFTDNIIQIIKKYIVPEQKSPHS